MPVNLCRRLSLLFLPLTALAPAAPAQTLQVTRQLTLGQPVKIVCFGDSITGVYYHTGGRRAWCDALGVALQRAYPQAKLEMINAGVSGNTTADGLRRMEADVLSHRPQLVVAMFGMNDVASATPDEFRANLGEIVRRSRERGAGIILMTPNWIRPEDSSLPPERVAEYAEIVRQTARELGVPVADAFTAFKNIHTTDRREWTRLMSDSIHPNWRGHLLFAAEAAGVIIGQKPALNDLPPLRPALPRVRARLLAGEPVRIVAMKPFDTLVGPALQAIHPGAQVDVTVWDPAGKSIAELEAEAKLNGWPKYREHPELPRPDLVVIAVPADAAATDEVQFYRSYAWILNWSQSFDQPRHDCLAVLPSVARPDLTPTQQTAEQRALEVIADIDLPAVQRSPGETDSPAEVFAARLKALLEP